LEKKTKLATFADLGDFSSFSACNVTTFLNYLGSFYIFLSLFNRNIRFSQLKVVFN